jgi:hypothetical protein
MTLKQNDTEYKIASKARLCIIPLNRMTLRTMTPRKMTPSRMTTNKITLKQHDTQAE